MKRELLVFSLIFAFKISFAQSFCEGTFPRYVKLDNCSPVVRAEIYAFNQMVKHFGLKDTIKYGCSDGETVLSYKDETLDDWKYDPKMCGKKLMLKYGKYISSFQILASIPIENGKAQVYEVIKPNKGRDKIIFKAYKEMGILPYGDYIEKNCDGQITVRGKYELVNTPSRYAYNRYDDEKKRNVAEHIDSKQTSVRAGLWEYFDEEGELIFQENYAENNFSSTAATHELCSDFAKNLKWNYYTIEDKISPAMDIFNAIYASLEGDMYISYDITQRGIVYYLNGSIIPNPFFDMKGKYKPWAYQIQNNGNNLLLEYKRDNKLRAYVPHADEKGEILIFEKKLRNRDKTLDVFQTLNAQPNGKFERRNCDGKLLFQGSYLTKDTAYVIREKTFDRNTYEHKWVETNHDFITVRTGKWNYYNENGELVLEENYPGTQKWSRSSEYLCTKLVDEAREMTKNLHNPFMTFNAMCHQASLDYWLSEDNILDLKTYYFNGKLTDSPEDISKQNYSGDFRFKTPNFSIELRANSKIPSATGRKKTKRKLNYSASFTFDGGKELHLVFYRNKLKKQEMMDGQKNGLYEERHCDGQILVEGLYCQIDTLYRDTVSVFNPETYEEIVTVTEHSRMAKKYGVWKYYDVNGVLVREEDYGSCK